MRLCFLNTPQTLPAHPPVTTSEGTPVQSAGLVKLVGERGRTELLNAKRLHGFEEIHIVAVSENPDLAFRPL